MHARRALFGVAAIGMTVLTAGSADALSWRRATCNEFRQSALDHDAFVRATVVRTWDARAGEEQWSSEVEASMKEGITGRGLPRGMTLTYTAQASEISGVMFGFIPAEGEEVVLFLDRGPDRRWVVASALTATDYDRYWAPRCAF